MGVFFLFFAERVRRFEIDAKKAMKTKVYDALQRSSVRINVIYL